MKRNFLSLEYFSDGRAVPTKASVVVFSKSTRHLFFIEEDKDNPGISLTNSIEWAVIELLKRFECDTSESKFLQFDHERLEYDLVEFPAGKGSDNMFPPPKWTSFDNSSLLKDMSSWLKLTEEEENLIG